MSIDQMAIFTESGLLLINRAMVWFSSDYASDSSLKADIIGTLYCPKHVNQICYRADSDTTTGLIHISLFV